MASRATNLRVAYDELMTGLHDEADAAVMAEAVRILLPAIDDITSRFYEDLLAVEGTHPYLNNDIVQKRLRHSLAGWLRELLVPQDGKLGSKFVDRQLEVGTVHARINIPTYLVNLGARFLKRDIFNRLLAVSSLSGPALAPLLIRLNDLFDTAVALINESYMGDVVSNERHAQSLKMHAVSHHLAIECERMRSALLDWSRRIIQPLYQDTHPLSDQLPAIRQSDFGLWLIHKADLIFQDNQEIESLKTQLERIDQAVRNAVSERPLGVGLPFAHSMQELNDAVTQATWLLSSLVDRTLEQEGGRDPLTRLFNRRYLQTILQRETVLSSTYNMSYGVALLDIDHFKRLNDTYGHDAGDTVLCQTAEVLTASVRAGDFVFRYGGEEFLVLLSDVNPQSAMAISEKLRQALEDHSFGLSSGEHIRATASFGVALHEGHPDYQTVITRADAALYEAKHNGRNRCLLAPPTQA